MKEVFSYTNLIIKGDSIEIMVDGIAVSGRIILRDKRNIAVEIISPYDGISESSCCIPLLGLQVHNFLGKTGDEKAATLLLAIYRFCAFVDDHKDSLLAALADYKYKNAYIKYFSPEANERDQRKVAVLQELQAIRKDLKAGKIDSIEYQRRIRPLSKAMKLLTEEPEIDLDAIFDECFNSFWKTPVWDIRRETVLAYLDSISKAKEP